MNEFFPDIAWRTILKEVKITAEDYYYTAKVSPEDPNEPGADPITVNTDCWIIDYAGYTYQITAISGNIVTLYDVNKRKWGENFIGPTPNMEAYVYLPKNGAFLLTQAQLRYLDKSATDKIYPVEKGVNWAHRGLEITPNEQLGIENITALRLSDKFTLDVEEEGWQGGKSYKLDVSSSSAPSEYLVKNIEQIAHGFILDFVFFDNTVWVKAVATTGETCATHFARKIDDDNFELIPVGELLIEGLLDENGDALVNGDYYFLSQTVEGKITGVKPEEGIIQSVLKVNATNTITISIQEPYDINDVGGGAGIDLQLTTTGDGGAATLDLETGILNIPIYKTPIQLTNTGSGAATFNSSTGALNIPIYQEQLVSGTNIRTINGGSILGDGNIIIDGGDISGSGTTNQIAYFTGTKTIASLSTTTYPSLTELSYVKGVTSSIQTQLNNKQATLLSGTNIKTVNSTTLLGSGNLNVGTVTSVAALTLGTTGTNVSSSVTNGTTTPVITLNIPTSSATNRGALSSTDWTTFNNKQNTLVSGTNIKTVAGNSLLGDSNVINIRVSATEPTSIGAISGDIWIEP